VLQAICGEIPQLHVLCLAPAANSACEIRVSKNLRGKFMNISTIYFDQVNVQLKTGIDIVDISHELQRLIKKSKIINGTLNATVVGSTGSITTIEFEPGVVKDLKRAITALASPGLEYEHEKAWHDGNGHSHVQAALLGSSIALPVRDGRLALGTWQQVVVINHDNKPRKRNVEVTIVGIEKSD